MTTYNVEIVINGRDNASGPLRGAGGALGNIAQIAGGILSAQLFVQIGQQLMGMARDAFAATAEYERMGMAMTSLVARELRHKDANLSMGEAMTLAGDKAGELLRWIEKLAISSPFDAQSIATSYRQFLTFGFGSEQAQKLTQVLVDMSAGAGLGTAEMDRISYALGQMNQTGKVLTLDLRQLMNAGVPVVDILETMGYTLDDVAEGTVKSSDFIAAFTKMLGDDFQGAAAAQATTWAGLANSLADIKKLGLREFFASTFEEIQPYVADFVGQFSDENFISNLREMGKPVGEFVGKVIGGLASLRNINMGTILGGLKAGLPEGTFDALFGAFQSIREFFITYGPDIAQAGRVVFSSIGDAIGAFVEKVAPFINQVLRNFSDWLKQNGPLIYEFALTVAAFFQNVVAPAIQNLWMILGPLLTGIAGLLMNVATLVMQIATGDWSGAWETIKQIAVGAWETIKNVVMGAVSWILSIFGTSLAAMQASWAGNWEQLAQIVGRIKVILGAKIVEFVRIGRDIVEGIKRGIKAAWSGIIATLTGLLGDLIEAVLKKLGISSPSKVFKGIGINIVKGMALGLTSSAGMAQDAMQGVLGRTVPAFAGATSSGGTMAMASGRYGNLILNNYGTLDASENSTLRDGILRRGRKAF